MSADIVEGHLNASSNSPFKVGEVVLVFKKDEKYWYDATILEIKKGLKRSYSVRFVGFPDAATVKEKYVKKHPDYSTDQVSEPEKTGSSETSRNLISPEQSKKSASLDDENQILVDVQVGASCEIYVPQKNTWISAKVLECNISSPTPYYRVEVKGKSINVRPKHLRIPQDTMNSVTSPERSKISGSTSNTSQAVKQEASKSQSKGKSTTKDSSVERKSLNTSSVVDKGGLLAAVVKASEDEVNKTGSAPQKPLNLAVFEVGQKVMVRPTSQNVWVRGVLKEIHLEESPTMYTVIFKKKKPKSQLGEFIEATCKVDERNMKKMIENSQNDEKSGHQKSNSLDKTLNLRLTDKADENPLESEESDMDKDVSPVKSLFAKVKLKKSMTDLPTIFDESSEKNVENVEQSAPILKTELEQSDSKETFSEKFESPRDRNDSMVSYESKSSEAPIQHDGIKEIPESRRDSTVSTLIEDFSALEISTRKLSESTGIHESNMHTMNSTELNISYEQYSALSKLQDRIRSLEIENSSLLSDLTNLKSRLESNGEANEKIKILALENENLKKDLQEMKRRKKSVETSNESHDQTRFPSAPNAPAVTSAPPPPPPPLPPPPPAAPGGIPAPPLVAGLIPGGVKGLFKSKKKKLKPLFWDKVDERELSVRDTDGASLWAKAKGLSLDIDFKSLEEKFSAEAPKESRKFTFFSKSEKEKPKKKIRVLSDKRSNALGILMSQLPAPPEVQRAIFKMDEKTLQKFAIETMLLQLPSKEEIASIVEVKDVELLENAERFVLMLIKIPFIETRLNCWNLKLSFDELLDEVQKPLEIFAGACKQLRTNETIPSIMCVILEIGNRLNDGTNRGEAVGFQIEVLTRLDVTKSSDGGMNLLEFIAQMSSEYFSGAEHLSQELGKVFIAQKQMGVADMMNKVNQIQSRFGSAKQSFIAVSTEAVQVAEDQFLTKMIQFFGDAESRVDKLQRLCAKVVTQYQELTKYFMCSERYDVKNSNEFFAIWTTFVDSLSKYLSSAQE